MAKTIELKVAEALQEDVGRMIARVDSKTRVDLKLEVGDIVPRHNGENHSQAGVNDGFP